MAKFVEFSLPGTAKQPVYVNVELLERIEQNIQGEAVFFFSNQQRLQVNETFESVGEIVGVVRG